MYYDIVKLRVSELREKLDAQSLVAGEQIAELKRQGEIFLTVVSQGQELNQLQSQLNANLESLRAADTFEQTLHSLSAAVHLLTAKTGSRAA